MPPPLGAPVGEPHLDPGLAQAGLLTQLLPGLLVGVVGVAELLLEVLQLGRLKRAPAPAELRALVLSILASVCFVRIRV